MNLELSLMECTELILLLNAGIADLREEIYRTEDYAFKNDLKRKKWLLIQMVGRLTEHQERDTIVA